MCLFLWCLSLFLLLVGVFFLIRSPPPCHLPASRARQGSRQGSYFALWFFLRYVVEVVRRRLVGTPPAVGTPPKRAALFFSGAFGWFFASLSAQGCYIFQGYFGIVGAKVCSFCFFFQCWVSVIVWAGLCSTWNDAKNISPLRILVNILDTPYIKILLRLSFWLGWLVLIGLADTRQSEKKKRGFFFLAAYCYAF